MGGQEAQCHPWDSPRSQGDLCPLPRLGRGLAGWVWSGVCVQKEQASWPPRSTELLA